MGIPADRLTRPEALQGRCRHEALLHPRRLLDGASHRAVRGRAALRPREGRPGRENDRGRRGLHQHQPEGLRAGSGARRRSGAYRGVGRLVQYLADQAPGSGLAPQPGTTERYKLLEWIGFVATELHKGFGPLWNPATPDAYKPTVRDNLVKRFGYL